MLDKLKMIAGGVLAGLGTLIWIIFKKRTAQRDQAVRDLARESRNVETLKASSEASEKIEGAKDEQITRNKVARNERRSRDSDDRFTGHTDFKRLRNKGKS